MKLLQTHAQKSQSRTCPSSGFEALERYCLQRQETKKQVIRTLLRRVVKKVADE